MNKIVPYWTIFPCFTCHMIPFSTGGITTEHQREVTEELRTTSDELDGNILALENFCRCLPNDVKHFGSAAPASHLQRIGDYIQQHMEDVRQIASLLHKDMQPQLRRAEEAGRVL